MTNEQEARPEDDLELSAEQMVQSGPEEEIAELKDKLLRALADVENTRRQKEREVDDARRYAVTKFARDLLEVSDNLRRALTVPAAASDDNPGLKNLLAGVEMTERSLQAAFERNQIKRIEPQIGEKLDPNRHQAMFEVPKAGAVPGAIAEVVQAGYSVADRLLRPAMVGVVARPTAVEQPASSNEPGQGVDIQA